MALRIDNRKARRLWLNAQGLAATPSGPLDVRQIIRDLGFVQLDTIRNVARAHDHILWSRNQNYREPMLDQLLFEKGSVFEHFTHDASVLPVEFYPMWQRQFRRLGEWARESGYLKVDLEAGELKKIKQRIESEGPLSTRDFNTKVGKKKHLWQRPPHKNALDQMWYAGELTTSHRKNFIKFYDLTERVIPKSVRDKEHADEEQVDWLCRAALDRLAFGTAKEIRSFWDAVDGKEVKVWMANAERDFIEMEIESKEGTWSSALAPRDIENRLSQISAPTSRLRIINPFDPAVRDRTRLSRLFGFDFRIEIFVSAAKRRWGYYVYPLLEGDRFIGRLEAKADRKNGILNVLNLWQEADIKWSAKRAEKLSAELDRMARFVGLDEVKWNCSQTPV